MSTAPRTVTDVLTKSQQLLRGRDIRTMSITELRDWIDACDKAEQIVKPNKARRSWTRSRNAAVEELQRRTPQ